MRLAAVLATLMACADTSTAVNIAPSADGSAEQAARVVDRLNDEIGGQVFTLRMSDYESRVDGEIIVRMRDDFDDDDARGLCRRTRKGVIVWITPHTTDVQFAHELGHAAGLDHHDDDRNFMFYRAVDWLVSWPQRNHLMGIQ